MRFRSLCAAVIVLALSACASTGGGYKIADVTEARRVSDKGLVLLATGDTSEALKALNAVIAYGSINDADYARRAAILGTRKEYDAALADANRAIELNDRSWRRYLERAVIYQRMGRYEEAITDLDAARKLDPYQAALLRRSAYLKIVASQFDGAIADYEELIRMMPRSDTGQLGRGAALYIAGRWSEAADQFADMLKYKPNDGLAALWLAKSRFLAGQTMAWADIQDGAQDEQQWNMTRALLTLGSEDEVMPLIAKVEACEKALFLGVWRQKNKDLDGAVADFRAALKTCPLDSIETRETQAALARLVPQS